MSTQIKAIENLYTMVLFIILYDQRSRLLNTDWLKQRAYLFFPPRQAYDQLLAPDWPGKCVVSAIICLQTFKHKAHFGVPQYFDFSPKLFDQKGKNIESKLEKNFQTKFQLLAKTS